MVIDQTQIGQRILDFLSFKKSQAAVNAIGNVIFN